MLKIFKQIKNAESVMAQRHVSKISTISISVVVFSLFFVTALSGPLGFPVVEDIFELERESVLRNMPENAEKDTDLLTAYASRERTLLIVRYHGETLYSRYDNHFYRQWFGPGDYDYTVEGGWEYFFDTTALAAVHAKENIMFFVIVVLTVLAYAFFYSPHFALTISDPVHVMRRGLDEQSYNLEVKIPPRYAGDDIYRLAASYNEKYLPLKDRTREVETNADSLDLKMEDLGNLFEEE